jgi:AcrR family transcriptional regulator
MAKNARGLESRTTMLNTALRLFSENGYDATSVAEICRHAGVSKGAFYHHFPSKQDLFLALMTTWLDGVDGRLQEAGEAAAGVQGALENMAVMSGGIFDDLEGGFPILLEFWRQASRKPAIWSRAVAPYRRYLEFFAGMIQSGIADGDFKDTLDPEQTARILMAMAMGLLLQASFDPEGVNWQETTRSGITIILRGLRSVT